MPPPSTGLYKRGVCGRPGVLNLYGSHMSRQRPEQDPGGIVRRFRQTYTNYHRLWTATDGVPEGVVLMTPEEAKLDESQLPAELAVRLAQYREEHPGEKVTLIKRMRTVNGEPELVVEDDRDLPDEDHLLTLSQTVTVNSRDTLLVITELFVARRD
jgi:hypothetical protein